MSYQKNKSQAYLLRDQAHDQKSEKQSLYDLLSLSKKSWFGLLYGISLILISCVLALMATKYIGLLVEDGLSKLNSKISYQYAVFILLQEGLALILMWWGRRVIAHHASQALFEIRKTCFSFLSTLPMAYYDREPKGRIITRLTHDIESLEQFFSSSLGRLIYSVMMVFISALAMIFHDPKIGSLLVLTMGVPLSFLYLTRKRTRYLNAEISRLNSKMNSSLSELYKGHEVIRLFGLIPWSLERYQGNIKEYLVAHFASHRFYRWSRPLLSFLCHLPLMFFLIYGGHLFLIGEIALGLFVAFIGYCERFFHPVMMLSREIHLIQAALVSADRVSQFLKTQTEDELLREETLLYKQSLSKNLSIEFKDVTMSYEENKKPVLKKVSFHIKGGESVALVGRTGSGKTTTVSLLQRLYEYQEGSITISDISLRSFDKKDLRDFIGFVSQDVILFKGSIKDNLTQGKDLSDKAYEFIKDIGLIDAFLKVGLTLDTVLVDEGKNLSAGQKQLISIVRAVLRKPRIMIFDEAMANIDQHHEMRIEKAIRKFLGKDSILLTITHRLLSQEHLSENFDRYIVFDQGQIIEDGSFNELMQLEGVFYNLIKRKSSALPRMPYN